MNREINCPSDDEYLRLINAAYPSPPKDKITSAVISRIKREKAAAKRLLITRYAGLAACFMLIAYAGFRILPMMNVKTATANDCAAQTEAFDECKPEVEAVTEFAYTADEPAGETEASGDEDSSPAEAPAPEEVSNGGGMILKSAPAMLAAPKTDGAAVTEEAAAAEPESEVEEAAEAYEVYAPEPPAENRIMRSVMQPVQEPESEYVCEDCVDYTASAECAECIESADYGRLSMSLPITVVSISGEDMDAEEIKEWILDGGDTSEVYIHTVTPQEYLAMNSRAATAATPFHGIIISAES